jgi:drug/metabolite transporter (DMT)-like permease
MVSSGLLAALAAGANACASVCQRAANRVEPDDRSLHLSLVLDVVRRPVWLAGFGGVIVSFLLQAAALSGGAIALVEPIMTGELPLTVALAAVIFRRRPTAGEWAAVLAMTGGLAAFIGFLSPGGATARIIPARGWAVGVGVTAAVIGVLVVLGRRSRRRTALAYGAATGAAFGLTAAFMTTVGETGQVSLAAVFTTWQTYAMACSGLLAMFLLQSALQAGPLAAAQPGITLSDPIVAVVWGVLVFGEHVSGGFTLIGVAGGAVMMLAGVVALARSPLAVWIADR